MRSIPHQSGQFSSALRLGALTASVCLATCLVGCQSNGDRATSQPQRAQLSTPTDAGVAGPASDRDAMRQKAWDNALRGVEIGDRVTVTEPTNLNDPNLAAVHVEHARALLDVNRPVMAIGA